MKENYSPSSEERKKTEGKLTKDQLNKLSERVKSDAKLIKNGAEYLYDEHSAEPRLAVSEESVKVAHRDMEIDMTEKRLTQEGVKETNAKYEHVKSLLNKLGFALGSNSEDCSFRYPTTVTVTLDNGNKIRGKLEEVKADGTIVLNNGDNPERKNRALEYLDKGKEKWGEKFNENGADIWRSNFSADKIINIEQ
jgi:hypothetical protein